MARDRKSYRRRMPAEYMQGGVVRFMTASEGFIMVRRPDGMPFIVRAQDWNSWEEVS